MDTPFPGSELQANRFRVIAELGRGGMGTVSRVIDTLSGNRELALKTIRVEAAITSEMKLRFKEEFRAMLKLKHPNTIEVFDYGQLDEQTQFLTMEIVEGHELSHLIRDRRLSLQEIYPLLIQLLRAIGFIHSRLYVHRDIKAENIRVKPDGTLKLMDFGLMDRLGIPSDGKITGTPGYLPPEVPRGGTISEASDLYSIGCLAYEMIVGELPFTGSLLDVIKAQVNTPAPDLRSRRPDVPLALEAVVSRLLAKDPRDRYQNASEVIGDLAALSGVSVTRESLDQKKSYLTSSVMVGREHELTGLQESLAQVRQSRGRSVFIGASAGIGKSRLLQEFVIQAKLDEVPVLRGKCLEQGGRPFEPLAEALRPLLLLTPPDELRAFGPVLVSILPELTERGIDPAPALGPGAEKARLHATLVSWVQAASARSPLILCIDDLQWSDANSLGAFNHLIRETRNHPVLVLGTFRNDECSASSPVCFTIEEGLTEHMRLSPLGLPQVLELIRSMLGSVNITPDFSEFLYQSTAGNAFFLTEIMRYLIEEGMLIQEKGVWLFPLSRNHVSLPDSVEATVLRRLRQLSDEARWFSGVAAVLGRRQNPDMLLAVSELAEDSFFQLVDELVERQFLLKQESGYLFPQDRVREALYADVPEGERMELHQRCADYLERLHLSGQSVSISELAHHFSCSPEQVKAYEYLRLAEKQAMAAGAQAQTLALRKQAEKVLAGIEIPNKRAVQSDLMYAIAFSSFQTWPATAIEVDARLIPMLEADPVLKRTRRLVEVLKKLEVRRLAVSSRLARRVRLAWRPERRPYTSDQYLRLFDTYVTLGCAHGYSGDPKRGLEALKTLERLMLPDTPLAGKALIPRVLNMLPAGRIDEVRDAAARGGVYFAPEKAQGKIEMFFYWFGTYGAKLTVSFQGYRFSQEVLDRLVAVADQAQLLPIKNLFFGRAGIWYAWTGRYQEAMGFLDIIAENCRRVGEPPHRMALYMRPYVLWQRGEYEEALSLCQQALRYQEVQDDALFGQLIHVLRGRLLVSLGNLEEAEAELQGALEVARDRGLGLVLLQALLGLARIAIVRSEPGRARPLLEEACSLASEGPCRNPMHHAIAMRLMAELASARGEAAEAIGLVREALAIVSDPAQDNLIEQGQLHELMGDIHLAAGRAELARSCWLSAIDRYRRIQNTYKLRLVRTRVEELDHAKGAPVGEATTVVPAMSAHARHFLELAGPATTEPELYEALLRTLMEVFEADEASIVRLDAERTVLACATRSGAGEPAGVPSHHLARMEAEQTGIFAIDLPEFAAGGGSMLEIEVRSQLLVPLGTGAVVYALKTDPSNLFDEDKLEQLTELCAVACRQIHHEQARKTQEDAIDISKLSHELRLSLRETLHTSGKDVLLDTLLHECMERLHLDGIVLMAGDEAAHRISTLPADTAVNMGLVSQALSSAQSLVSIDFSMPEDAVGSLMTRIPSVAVTPILKGSVVRGAVYCVRLDLENPLGEQDLEAVESCAQVLGEALDVLGV